MLNSREATSARVCLGPFQEAGGRGREEIRREPWQGGEGSLRRFRAIRRLECVFEAHRFDKEADQDTTRRLDALVEVELANHKVGSEFGVNS